MRRRADIIVQGEVKEAGYRAYIMKMAERNKLVGFVENLPNRAVHIVCEGEEEDIDSFLEQIGAEMDFVEIEGIERELTEPTGEFNVFEVKVQDMAYELFQGFATSRKYFGWLGDKMDKGFTGLGDKMDKGFTGLGDKMDKGF
ncbi:MAG: acylphosphatase, partial [Thermoplasmata archaeon]